MSLISRLSVSQIPKLFIVYRFFNRFFKLSTIATLCFQTSASGRYVITATNGVGTPATHSFNLNVELPKTRPKFVEKPGDVTLVTGDSHVISATITGTPTPEVTVTDPSGNRVPGEAEVVVVDEKTIRYSIKLPNIQLEDAGRYTVTASNGIGKPVKHKFDMEVELAQRAPVFTEVPRDVTVTAGKDHVILAEVTGVPTPSVHLNADNDAGFLGLGQIVKLDRETVQFSLSIPNIQVQLLFI